MSRESKSSVIWQREASLDALNQMADASLLSHLGIRFTGITARSLEATLPVDARTRQPFGLLHGGAAVVLAESLGSMASWLCSKPGASVVGTEINASHLRAVTEGDVRGICQPLHLGTRSQVWQTEIVDSHGRCCCIARLTTTIMQP
ncbi:MULTISPECIES: hotdog fold thioesterase [Dickeya]|uniref:Thioesterase necessary for optimal production of chrysobactin n=1 Tax=Dickeya aquatica TaxID=1401087 RepID=A0A375A9D6_9GAMM|nr:MULTISPECIES: hotdog fold thioesterase [Dickeya]SLM62259.1 Thioesterase necessary for optimal production of chrysobactin [Dickeya aquatica]